MSSIDSPQCRNDSGEWRNPPSSSRQHSLDGLENPAFVPDGPIICDIGSRKALETTGEWGKNPAERHIASSLCADLRARSDIPRRECDIRDSGCDKLRSSRGISGILLRAVLQIMRQIDPARGTKGRECRNERLLCAIVRRLCAVRGAFCVILCVQRREKTVGRTAMQPHG